MLVVPLGGSSLSQDEELPFVRGLPLILRWSSVQPQMLHPPAHSTEIFWRSSPDSQGAMLGGPGPMQYLAPWSWLQLAAGLQAGRGARAQVLDIHLELIKDL